jgi:hypothetical protein
MYVPAVQRYAVRRCTAVLAASYGIRLEMGYFRLSWPLRLRAEDVLATDAEGDTLLGVSRFAADVRPLSLKRGAFFVEGLEVEDVRIRTKSLIDGMELAGAVGFFYADSFRIRPAHGRVRLNRVECMDADVMLRIDSLAAGDTAQSSSAWSIVLKEVQLQRIAFELRIPSDTLHLQTAFENLTLTDGAADTGAGQYRLTECLLSGGFLAYDAGKRLPKTGLDPSHICLSEVTVAADSVFYHGRDINAFVRTFSAREQSGLAIVSMNGRIRSDTAELNIPHWSLRTPYSDIELSAAMPWDLRDNPQSLFTVQFRASIGRQDAILLPEGAWTETVRQVWPKDSTLRLLARLDGHSDALTLHSLSGGLSGVFGMEAHGVAGHIQNPSLRTGHADISLWTGDKDISFTQRFNLPCHTNLKIEASIEKREYNLLALMDGAAGKASVTGIYHSLKETYDVALEADSLETGRFLPTDSVGRLTASVHASGRGLDLFSDSTQMQFTGALQEMRYKQISLYGISLDGSLDRHHLLASLNSLHPSLQGRMTVDAMAERHRLAGTLRMDMDSLDVYGLGMTNNPLVHSFRLVSEVETDWRKQHRLDMTLDNWEMKMLHTRAKPKTLTLHTFGDKDTTSVAFRAGDFEIAIAGDASPGSLANQLKNVSDEVMQSLREDTVLPLAKIRSLLPCVRLHVGAAHDNPVYEYLQAYNVFFDRFTLDASASPEEGLRASGLLLSFIKDTMKVDTVRMQLWQDADGLNYTADVIKEKFRRQEPFRAGLKGGLRDDCGSVEMYFLNSRGEAGLNLGMTATRHSDGLHLHFFPARPVIAFLPFRLNEDNDVRIKDAGNMSANLQFDGEAYASLRLHSLEKDSVMKELMLEIRGIDLQKVMNGFPKLPPVEGLANVSLRYVPDGNNYMLVADAGIDSLMYNGEPVGELLLNAVYLPLDKSKHQVDMHFFHDRKEVSTLSALYRPEKGGLLDGAVEINRLPLGMFNPFIAGTARLGGFLEGNTTVAGTAKSPLLTGLVQLDTATADVMAAGARLRFGNQPVRIEDSRLHFDAWPVYSAGTNPFVVNGYVDMHNLRRSMAELQLTADNMLLFDSKKNSESVVYGKMAINLRATVKGPVNALVMRGKIHLSGNTNMSYVLRDSPLASQDRMADLVTFSYFQDTLPRNTQQMNRMRRSREYASVGGMDMLLEVGVDPNVKLKIDLDETGSDRIELTGGGDLNFRYTPQGDISLTGRYTLTDGTVRYNMPVIANKKLTVKENSFIEWSGDPMNPYLDLKATERVRTTVSTDGQTAHSVNFDAGIALKNTLENMELQFTLDALDDLSVQDQLAAMSADERNKQAISMLLTGMYLAGDPSGMVKVDMGTALNHFLQSEINHITGSLLKDVDIDFGVDSYDGQNSGQRTDYSFRFSKRFYDDRLNVVLGGLVSTGDIPDQQRTFINDASLEYRLDAGGSRYAKLFYNRQYESLLEGEITKYGAGVVFRKKMRQLKDLFIFQRRKRTVNKNSTDER